MLRDRTIFTFWGGAEGVGEGVGVAYLISSRGVRAVMGQRTFCVGSYEEEGKKKIKQVGSQGALEGTRGRVIIN